MVCCTSIQNPKGRRNGKVRTRSLHYIEIENKFCYNRFSNSLFTKNKEKIMHYVILIWIPLLISKVSQQFLIDSKQHF